MPATTPASDLFDAFFDLSLLGGIVFAPVLGDAGAVVDFTYVRLNPAAQRMLVLPEYPAESFLARYPHALPTGIFAFYREAFEAGEVRHGEFNYQYDGLDNYFHLAARRVGEQLLVSFTDTSDQPRTAVEVALRQSQAAQAQRQLQQREELFQVFEQAPAAIVLLHGRDHRIEYANPAYQQLFPGVALRGRPLADTYPDIITGEGLARLDQVYATGEPHAGEERPVALTLTPGQPPQTHYFNFTYQPYREEGRIVGVSIFAYNVTAAVLARRAAAQELERQQGELQRILEQAPSAIFVLYGPQYVLEVVNLAMGELLGQPVANLRGRPYFEVLPELVSQGYPELLAQVQRTGQPLVLQASPARLARHQPGETGYFDFVYQPLYDGGQFAAIMCVATDVTAQVVARQQIEQVNQELEIRVQERTRETRAAQAVNERERALLQALLTQAPVAISLFQGEELRVTSVNSLMAGLWGHTPEQLLNKPLLEGVPELRGQGFDDMLRQVLATQVPVSGTETPATMLRDGVLKTTYYNFVYQPLYNAEGEVLGVIDVATEVTEQVETRRQLEQLTQEAQAARAEAERQRGELERVFEQAPLAIAVYRGPTYTIELANATVARLWGRTREQLLGKGLFEALPEVAGLGFEELLDGVMATGVPYVAHGMEAQHERDGHLETVYWDFVYVPTYAADGHINGAMVVATEATAQVLARRQMEQLNQELETRVSERTRQLSEQQALLRQILGQVPASIATLSGPEHRYTFFNELYQELTGNRATLARTVAEVLPEVVEQGFIDLLDQVYATGEPFVGTDMPALLLDTLTGQPRQYYMDFIYQPLFDGQRRVQGILAFTLDVTDRARARQQAEQSQLEVQTLNQELAVINEELLATNEELHTSNNRLVRTNTDLDTFVYTASHDLKAPITNIEGLLTALRDYLPANGPEPMVTYLLGLMEKSVARFLQTISQLTDISRLQNAAQEPAKRMDLASLLEDLRLDLLPLLASTHGQVLVEVEACPTVVFSPKNLRSIMYNLLSNALKYHAPDRDPVVQVRASCSATQVQLEVQDNGLGLTEQQQGKLFALFERLHTHVEGTGVGLYMLKRIVENANGTITVRSQPGVGSTFTVLLPRLML